MAGRCGSSRNACCGLPKCRHDEVLSWAGVRSIVPPNVSHAECNGKRRSPSCLYRNQQARDRAQAIILTQKHPAKFGTTTAPAFVPILNFLCPQTNFTPTTSSYVDLETTPPTKLFALSTFFRFRLPPVRCHAFTEREFDFASASA